MLEVRTREVSRDVRDLLPVRRGLGAAWSADAGRTQNGIAVSAWRDTGRGAADLVCATGASQPVLVPGAVGARNALRFDGSNDVMHREVTAAVDAGPTGVSLVFVAQGRAGSTGDYPLVFSQRPWTAGSDAGWAVSCNGSAQQGRVTTHYADGSTGFDNSSAAAVATRGLSLTRRELWCVVFDHLAQRLRFYVNGQIDVVRAPTWPSAVPVGAGLTSIGAERAPGSGARFLSADLFAVAVHRAALTTVEVERYAARWMPLFGVR